MPLLIKPMLKGTPKLKQGSFETLRFLWILEFYFFSLAPGSKIVLGLFGKCYFLLFGGRIVRPKQVQTLVDPALNILLWI